MRQRSPSGLSGLDVITSEDWKILSDIVQILEPFHQLTLDLQGHRENGVLYDIFPAMDSLLSHLEDAKAIVTETPRLV